jgi:predicted nucleic acid-binding protein
MIALAIRQQAVLADTSPFCRLAESGVCELLADYLAARLHLTSWVIAELEHRARQPRHAQLKALESRGHARDERANLGEATTIIAARQHSWALLLDEGRARTYAEHKGLTVLSTQDLVVELAAAGRLGQRRAQQIYQRVYRSATAAAFTHALATTRGLLEG